MKYVIISAALIACSGEKDDSAEDTSVEEMVEETETSEETEEETETSEETEESEETTEE
jgi:hypothetical protein